MTPPVTDPPGPASDLARIARCVACGAALRGRPACAACGRPYPVRGGVMEALGPLAGRNRVAARFYDGPDWSRFRFWEDVFLWFQGPGVSAARRQVLRHLRADAHAGAAPSPGPTRVLEVGIGDGENLPRLPGDWEVFGVDLAAGRLAACVARFPETAGRLALAEAERLPFEDATFDAVFTVGGINYFNDPAAALGEMRRVARPGAALVAADELPDLYRFAPGHVVGLEALDRALLRLGGLDREFLEMVYATPPVVEPAARGAWPGHRRVPIWNRLGYCLVDVRHD